jgi:glycosyltransferase involved in cell wall biosynthesis
LNEADTLGSCIRKAQSALAQHNVDAEIIVADNGSTDESPQLAEKLGARVVKVQDKGYGNALQGGIAAARGDYVVMGDADDSYDFLEIPRFVEALRKGFDLVQGCRFPSGGGDIRAGAMPFLHRWWGNPLLSWLARWWFGTPVRDVYCGLRGFRRDSYQRLGLQCAGMEFATEMIIKASLYGHRIAEVPVTLHPDGRKAHPPHLRTFRDGWRTLRFFLIYSPRWLFLAPGLLMIVMGSAGYAVALPRVTLSGITFDAHTLLFASLFVICGYQSILFALFTKTFATTHGLLPEDPHLNRFYRLVNLEKGLLISAAVLLLGLTLLLIAIGNWAAVAFGRLDYSNTMRLVIPGATLTVLGFQTILSSFFVSVLGLARRTGEPTVSPELRQEHGRRTYGESSTTGKPS